MNWKKNAFSFVMWLLYAIMTCSFLVWAACSLCAEAGIGMYWGIPSALLFLVGTGIMVFLLHRFATALSSSVAGKRRIFLLLETVAAVFFLSAGLILRLFGLESAGQTSNYYDIALVAEGQEISGISHAAEYLYVQILHGAFVLLGNHFMIGIWIQIALQLMTLLVLFFTVRKLAGSVSALVVLGFGACGPYMIGEALVLSPRMLYLLFLVIAVALTAAALVVYRPKAFWLTGILTALCCYLDIAGILLIFFTFAFLFHCSQEVAGRKKLSAAWRYAAGVILGAFACVFLDASLSGTTIWRTVEDWSILYMPDGFGWTVTVKAWNFGAETVVLFGLMAFGIFSFWCDRQREHVSFCMLALCVVAFAGCWGVFTQEMSGSVYMYLLLVLSASLGVGQSFHVSPQEEAKNRYGWEAWIEKIEENESQREIREEKPWEGQPEEERIQYIENPLPLPKKHVKRVMDYSLQTVSEGDDFDYPVSEEDDFDI